MAIKQNVNIGFMRRPVTAAVARATAATTRPAAVVRPAPTLIQGSSAEPTSAVPGQVSVIPVRSDPTLSVPGTSPPLATTPYPGSVPYTTEAQMPPGWGQQQQAWQANVNRASPWSATPTSGMSMAEGGGSLSTDEIIAAQTGAAVPDTLQGQPFLTGAGSEDVATIAAGALPATPTQAKRAAAAQASTMPGLAAGGLVGFLLLGPLGLLLGAVAGHLATSKPRATVSGNPAVTSMDPTTAALLAAQAANARGAKIDAGEVGAASSTKQLQGFMLQKR